MMKMCRSWSEMNSQMEFLRTQALMPSIIKCETPITNAQSQKDKSQNAIRDKIAIMAA